MVAREVVRLFDMACVLFLLLFGYAYAEPSLRTCEPIRVDMCTGLGYNETGMPNLVGHERQKDAVMILKTFQPLIEYGCSAQLKFFLCSVYLPMCTDKVVNPIGPCRGLCEKVRSRCFPVLQGFGFPWPSALNCSRFPIENNHEHMCMEGPSDVTTGLPVSVYLNPPLGLSPCSKLTKSTHYFYVNRSGRCVPYCSADILFDTADKNLAEVWLSIWAALCFVSTLVVVLTFAVDSSNRGRYPEKPLVFLALCYVLVSIGWGVRSAAGRNAVACRPDDNVPGRLLLTEDGFSNANCAVVFLLLYYFGMAASVWWTVLCWCWLSTAGLKWTVERLQGISSFLHLAAWGLPAAQTVAVLVRRDVDADELTGACYVGAQNPKTLLHLVLIPQAIYLIIGTIFLSIGAFLVSRKGVQINREADAASPSLPDAPCITKPRNRSKGQLDLVKLGVYGVLYMFPMAVVVTTMAYVYFSRPSWLAGHSKPHLWIHLLHIFMSLVVGITSISWIWSPRTLTAWKKFVLRLLPRPAYHRPPIKCQPVVRYAPTPTPTPTQSSQQQIALTHQGGSIRVNRYGHKHRQPQRPIGYHHRSGSEAIV